MRLRKVEIPVFRYIESLGDLLTETVYITILRDHGEILTELSPWSIIGKRWPSVLDIQVKMG